MHEREPAQRSPAAVGQQNVHDRMAAPITPARDQGRPLRTIDQANHAVVAQHQRLGELADRRPSTHGAAAYRQQQLMLRRSQTMLFRPFLAPMQKATQTGAQPQQLLVLLLGQIIVHNHNISHYDIGARAFEPNHPKTRTPTMHGVAAIGITR